MSRKEHWESLYASKKSNKVSWYAPHLEDSLSLVREASRQSSHIIDVGGGASTLVDDLLAEGYRYLTVLDISSTAIELTRARLGQRAVEVTFVVADVTNVALPPAGFELWHDRAVFHFLTEPQDRRAYIVTLTSALALGGHVVLATFAPHGPEKCSGLDVVRYDSAGLQRELGPAFALRTHFQSVHLTPAGREQAFTFASFERVA